MRTQISTSEATDLHCMESCKNGVLQPFQGGQVQSCYSSSSSWLLRVKKETIHMPIASPVQQVIHTYTVSLTCVDHQRAWNWRRWDRRLQREVPPTVLETRGGFKILSKDCEVVGTSRRGISEWLVRSWLPGRFSEELNCCRGLVELR